MNQETRWADLNKDQLHMLASQLTQAVFNVEGKSTFKEEFVTAGGVDLKEINFKTFEKYIISNPKRTFNLLFHHQHKVRDFASIYI